MSEPDAKPKPFLDANPDIEAVQLVLTDANGVGRGKNIAREELDGAIYARPQRGGLDTRPRHDRRGRRGDGPRLVGRRCRPVLPARARLALPRALAEPADGAGARHDVPTRRSSGAARIRATCWAASCSAAWPLASRRSLPWSSSSICWSAGRRAPCDPRVASSPASNACASMRTDSAGSTTCRHCSTSCMRRHVRRVCPCAH